MDFPPVDPVAVCLTRAQQDEAYRGLLWSDPRAAADVAGFSGVEKMLVELGILIGMRGYRSAGGEAPRHPDHWDSNGFDQLSLLELHRLLVVADELLESGFPQLGWLREFRHEVAAYLHRVDGGSAY